MPESGLSLCPCPSPTGIPNGSCSRTQRPAVSAQAGTSNPHSTGRARSWAGSCGSRRGRLPGPAGVAELPGWTGSPRRTGPGQFRARELPNVGAFVWADIPGYQGRIRCRGLRRGARRGVTRADRAVGFGARDRRQPVPGPDDRRRAGVADHGLGMVGAGFGVISPAELAGLVRDWVPGSAGRVRVPVPAEIRVLRGGLRPYRFGGRAEGRIRSWSTWPRS